MALSPNQPVRKNTSWTRILLSATLLGLLIYYVQRQQPGAPTKHSPKVLPVGPATEDVSSRFRWVPRYPGVEIAGIRTKRTAGQLDYSFQFEVKGDFQPVLSYYEDQLQRAGLKVDRKGQGEFGAALHAEDGGRGRIVEITAGKLQGVSEIDVNAMERFAQ